jgi:hypothetical protein
MCTQIRLTQERNDRQNAAIIGIRSQEGNPKILGLESYWKFLF